VLCTAADRGQTGGLERNAYPSDGRDEAWAFVAPELTLLTADAPQRPHRRREVFTGGRWLARAGAPWRLMPNDLPPWEAVAHQTQRWLTAGVFDALVHDRRMLLRLADGRTAQPSAPMLESRTLQSSPASGQRAGDAGATRERGRQGPMAGATRGHLRAVQVTPAKAQDRAQVEPSTAQGQEVTSEALDVACVAQGDTGGQPAQDAAAHGLPLEVVTRPEAKNGLGLRPRRGVVERRVAWAARCRRLARGEARLPATLAGVHVLAFAMRWLTRFVALRVQSA
jgi:transposase